MKYWSGRKGFLSLSLNRLTNQLRRKHEANSYSCLILANSKCQRPDFVKKFPFWSLWILLTFLYKSVLFVTYLKRKEFIIYNIYCIKFSYMFKLSSLLTSRDEEFKCNERKIIPAFFSPCIKVNTVTKFIIYLNHCVTDSRTTAKPCSGELEFPIDTI